MENRETKGDSPINTIEYNNNYISTGLTKREYFAAMAMQELLTKFGNDYELQIAKDAIYWADALIEELNKTKQDA